MLMVLIRTFIFGCTYLLPAFASLQLLVCSDPNYGLGHSSMDLYPSGLLHKYYADDGAPPARFKYNEQTGLASSAFGTGVGGAAKSSTYGYNQQLAQYQSNQQLQSGQAMMSMHMPMKMRKYTGATHNNPQHHTNTHERMIPTSMHATGSLSYRPAASYPPLAQSHDSRPRRTVSLGRAHGIDTVRVAPHRDSAKYSYPAYGRSEPLITAMPSSFTATPSYNHAHMPQWGQDDNDRAATYARTIAQQYNTKQQLPQIGTARLYAGYEAEIAPAAASSCESMEMMSMKKRENRREEEHNHEDNEW